MSFCTLFVIKASLLALVFCVPLYILYVFGYSGFGRHCSATDSLERLVSETNYYMLNHSL